MKAVVLARGLARRMKEDQPGAALDRDQAAAAGAGQKAMMPVGAGRRPFLDYILSSLADAGASDVGLVIGPEHQAIRRRYEEGAPGQRTRVTFLIQEQPLGTANAVLACESWTQDEPFLVMNGDNLYPVPALRDLCGLNTPGLPAFERDALVRDSNIPAERSPRSRCSTSMPMDGCARLSRSPARRRWPRPGRARW
jgi:NDP-sugar pyrophosphorylase family protein